ncbi:2-hydroxy-3-oxopropionate reductase [Nesterenkonia alkaliphila]|nr:2-hydroxy-3-oxopropionate reductase [Nesterenkonia alkaliphila]
MAGHLIDAGLEVSVYNRTPAKAQDLLTRGATGAASIAEVGKASEVVITMLPDSPDVEAVLFAEEGLVSSLPPGALVIDCSTISPESAARIGAQLAEAGMQFVDAPVSGGEVGAVAGKLAIMMGGESEAVTRAQQVLSVFASAMAHVGPAGSGQLVKAANQMLVAGNIALVGEAISLLQRTEVDIPSALEVLNGGLAASRVLEVKGPAMLERNFTPGFRLDLHYKDLRIALAAAEQAGLAVPLTGLTTQLVQALRAAGDGGEDHGALIKAIERLSGVVLPEAGGTA